MVDKRTGDITRRKFLKKAGSIGAVAAVGPWVISPKALSSSGEVNVLMWSDYLTPDFLEAFTGETGIKVNYTGIGDNGEIVNKMKATKGQGFDICSPTNMKAGIWEPLELLQAWDYGKISNIGNVNSAMLKVGDNEWDFGGKGSHWLPHIWGTEGVAWRTDLYSPEGGQPSYGNIWDGSAEGNTMIRDYSGMMGAALYMETIGELEPGDLWKSYQSEEIMRSIWDRITAYCIKNKNQIKKFWRDADAQKTGFSQEGVLVGQTWDGPPLAMKTEGEPIQYQAPKEGSLAWVDGMCLSVAAENIDQTYALVDFAFLPEPAGKAIDTHGYNSAVLGASKFAGETYAKNFSEAYPGDALTNLNPWPKESTWFLSTRDEYSNKFLSA